MKIIILLAALLYLPLALAQDTQANANQQTLQSLNAQNRAKEAQLNTAPPGSVSNAERARVKRNQQDIQRAQRETMRGQAAHPAVPTIQQQMRQQRVTNPSRTTGPGRR